MLPADVDFPAPSVVSPQIASSMEATQASSLPFCLPVCLSVCLSAPSLTLSRFVLSDQQIVGVKLFRDAYTGLQVQREVTPSAWQHDHIYCVLYTVVWCFETKRCDVFNETSVFFFQEIQCLQVRWMCFVH